MTTELNARGFRAGKERVRKTMQINGIKAKGKKRFVNTTDSNHKLRFARDLVQRNFTPAEPNRVWSSDITYIATDEGWLFQNSLSYATSKQNLCTKLVWTTQCGSLEPRRR